MIRFWKRLRSSEKGQALSIVLGLLAIGGLTIAVSLNYATTNLKGSRIVEEKTDGVYAAGAGVEYALWSLQKGLWSLPVEGSTTSNATPENINQMEVAIQAENKGTYTMYLGDLEDPSDKPGVVTISGNLSGVGGNRYLYTINITRTAEPGGATIHLEEIGARLPVGYTYNGSATWSDGGEPIEDWDPKITQDSAGADLLQWKWKAANRPSITKDGGTVILTFYITGEGSREGNYVWTVADPVAYGLYGEITGTRYEIIATATRPEDGRTTAEIVAAIMKAGGAMYVMSWQITK